MPSHTPRQRYRVEIGDDLHELRSGEYRSWLYDVVTACLLEKEASRASYVLAGTDADLDELSRNLYRHLKQQRCSGPSYENLGGDAQSFRLHSVVDALVGVHFFFAAGQVVPHFFVGHGRRDLIACMERGVSTRVHVEKPELLHRIRGLAGDAD